MVVEVKNNLDVAFNQAKKQMWLKNAGVCFIKLNGLEIKIHLKSTIEDIREKYILLKELQVLRN